MVETFKKRVKNTVITIITLTISNGEHIKHTLSTSRPYRHQQHLPKIFQNVSLELYGWQFHMKEIPALFVNCYVRAFATVKFHTQPLCLPEDRAAPRQKYIRCLS